MARNRKGSPRIDLEITDADRTTAVASNSGGCLIADALKRAGYTNPTVDMATIRVTDREQGKRYIYLTPPTAQHLLLSFDQGWPVEGIVEVILRRAVKVVPITASIPRTKRRATRLAELEEKAQKGQELSKSEKASLTRLRQNLEVTGRPTSTGPAEITDDGTVVGGTPPVQGPAHPNLLRGRNRVFGARLADPGKAFEEAVNAAVQEREVA